MMDFFKDLKKAAYEIEKGIKEVDRTTKKNSTRDDDDISNKAALLLLRDKQEELQKTKKKASRLLRSLQGDPVPFVHVVTLCEQLFQKNLEILEKTECHLKQYGYQPPVLAVTTPAPKQAADTAAESKTVDAEGTGPEDSHERPEPTTPESIMAPPVDLSRTPNLADFGLSESTMRLFTGTGTQQKLSKPQPTQANRDANFKVPGYVTSQDHRPRPEGSPKQKCKPWLGSQVPSSMDNDGLLVTPGMMPGLNNCTPVSADRLSVQFGSSPVVNQSERSPDRVYDCVSTLHLISDSSDDSRSPTLDRSPVPPVLCTPGLKQFSQKSVQNKHLLQVSGEGQGALYQSTPEAPLMMTPGVRQLNQRAPVENKHMSATHLTAQGGVSTPEAPLMMTPGVRQLNQRAPVENKHISVTHLTTQDAVSTPEAPLMMTPGLRQITQVAADNIDVQIRNAALQTPTYPDLMGSYNWKPGVSKSVLHEAKHLLPPGANDADGALRLDVSVSAGRTGTDGGLSTGQIVCASPDTDFLSKGSMLRGFEEECQTPEAPELTFSYKSFLSGPQPMPPAIQGSSQWPDQSCSSLPGATSVDQVSSAPPSPALSMAVSDMGTPEPPELTYTFRTQQIHGSPEHKSLAPDKENQCPNVSVESKAPSKSNIFHSGPPKPSFPEEVSTCMYVPLLTVDEYKKQPKYLQTCLKHDALNQSIKAINILLYKKIQAGEQALVCDLDLQENLTSTQCRGFFLCLMRLGYLTVQQSVQGHSYYGLSQNIL